MMKLIEGQNQGVKIDLKEQKRSPEFGNTDKRIEDFEVPDLEVDYLPLEQVRWRTREEFMYILEFIAVGLGMTLDALFLEKRLDWLVSEDDSVIMYFSEYEKLKILVGEICEDNPRLPKKEKSVLNSGYSRKFNDRGEIEEITLRLLEDGRVYWEFEEDLLEILRRTASFLNMSLEGLYDEIVIEWDQYGEKGAVMGKDTFDDLFFEYRQI